MEFVLTLIYPKSVFAIKSTSYSQESAPAHCDLTVNGGAVLFQRTQSLISGKPSSLEVHWGQRTALMEISLWQ